MIALHAGTTKLRNNLNRAARLACATSLTDGGNCKMLNHWSDFNGHREITVDWGKLAPLAAVD